jgi:hypothetical protein
MAASIANMSTSSLGMERVERLNLALSVGATAAGLAFVSPLFAVSVAVGAAIETVSLHHLMRTGRQMFEGQPQNWNAGYALRFVLVGLGLGLALWGGAHPVGLVLGLSLGVPATILEAWRSRPAPVENAPALPPDDPSWDRWNPWLARERDESPEETEERP